MIVKTQLNVKEMHTSLHQIIHAALSPWLYEGAWAVDATVGNGHDTLFLARAVGSEGHVWGFDVQEEALRRAGNLLRTYGVEERVTLIHGGHEEIDTRLPSILQGRISVVMFNLGYLPGGDKQIITRTETTLQALEKALAFLKSGGVISMVLYPGHPGGMEEARAVRAYVHQRDGKYFRAYRMGRVRTRQPAPEWLLLQRL